MIISSWNVNSVRARIENIKSYLLKYKPDILMMQEIKTEDLNFPYDEFSSRVEKQQDELQQKVIKAQEILNSVQMDDDLRLNISAICGELDVDGLRGDIVTNRSARAIAAFEGRTEVQEDDIARVISCSLRHRLRKDPLEQVDSGERVIQAFCKVFDLDEKENLSKFQLSAEA